MHLIMSDRPTISL